MITNSRILQFNRPDLCKETILEQARLHKFQFQVKKTQNLMKQIPRIKVTLLMVMMKEEKQTLMQKKMEVLV